MPEQILPFYVVCDQSYSMTDHLDALNDGLAQLHRAVGTDPVVADKTRFCLIGFSGTAEVLQPLCRLSDVLEIVGLTTQAGTSFGEAFTLLRDTIENDVELLRADAHRVYRPAVFFLSDGHPTDPATWPAAYERLVAPDWPPRPNIISFGIGDADATTIGRIGTFQAFMSQGGVGPTAALHGFVRALTTSVVRSGGIAQEGGLLLQLPEQVTGFTALQVDPVP
ncbi:MAG: vWA domain-containing protein [Actinophytocola sp.]|uniref:vWA domain-containing protein n=1 Tax=Actinophytocola sp. TaxID=1872138 RepID=UPI003D6BFD3E